MSKSIDVAFISQFETEVKLDYQRMGSKLGNTIRSKTNVAAKDTTFQRAGKGTAGQKSRHGQVPLMNINHSPVKVSLEDWYAGDFIDKLDELKTNIDERKVVSESGAAALGRRQDDIIVNAMKDQAGNALIAAAGTGLTQAKINTVFERFGVNEIPDDNERYFCVAPENWTDLLAITAFSSADYVGADDLPYKGGMIAKRWMGFLFFSFSGLANGAGGATEARNMAYHRNAVGHASGAEISSTVSFENKEQAHLIVYSMSMGAVTIDNLGVQMIDAVR